MTIIITDAILADTTLDVAAKGIANGLANVSGSADACKFAYLAARNGETHADIAKAASAIMAANPKSVKKSISKAAIEQRVAAYAFLIENALPFQSGTVALAYTLAGKPTKSERFAEILENLANENDVKYGRVERELIDANDRALKAIKDAKDNQGGDGEQSDESKADGEEAASILQDDAATILAYLRAQLTREWSAKDKKALIAGFQAAVATLTV